MATEPERRIALVGLMGAGKSAVARALGERLGASIADIDDMIEAEEGRSVADVFALEGEPYFREREGQLLEAALASGARVIACGGGIILSMANRALLRDRCTTVWLDVDPQVAAQRLRDDRAARPLLGGGSRLDVLTRISQERAAFYKEVACLRVAAGKGSPDELAAVILAGLRDAAAK